MNPCPGFLTDKPSGAVGYFSCPSGLKNKITGNYYLQNHPNLQWVMTNYTYLYSMLPYNFVSNFFGRTVFNNTTYIGRIKTGQRGELSLNQDLKTLEKHSDF